MTRKMSKEAIAPPTKAFTHPSEVVSSAELSLADRVRVLKQWELDARLLQVASEEGMSGGEANMLADVKKAQTELAKQMVQPDDTVGQKPKGAPTKSGI